MKRMMNWTAVAALACAMATPAVADDETSDSRRLDRTGTRIKVLEPVEVPGRYKPAIDRVRDDAAGSRLLDQWLAEAEAEEAGKGR